MKNPFYLLLLLAGLMVAGCSTVSSSSSFPLQYKNADYGFEISLPASWQGFTVVQEKREWLTDLKIFAIRHPQWSAKEPYQDIPIYVFTIEQWTVHEERGAFALGAGGFDDEIYRNVRFVFATHNRDFWFSDSLKNIQEAADILAHLINDHPEAAGRRTGGR